jgi:hypothetical protein
LLVSDAALHAADVEGEVHDEAHSVARSRLALMGTFVMVNLS